MNSRSARKDTKANNTVAAVSPSAQANQNTSVMNHEWRSSTRACMR